MHFIEGRRVIAYWLAAAGMIALVRLLVRASDVFAHPAGWRAAAGPLVIAVSSLVAARRLLGRRGGFRFAAVVLALQLVAVSLGPLAYRLDVGPFVRVGVADAAMFTDVGSDARLLLILGDGNRAPFGLALNVLPLAALALLVAGRRSSNGATLTCDR